MKRVLPAAPFFHVTPHVTLFPALCPVLSKQSHVLNVRKDLGFSETSGAGDRINLIPSGVLIPALTQPHLAFPFPVDALCIGYIMIYWPPDFSVTEMH